MPRLVGLCDSACAGGGTPVTGPVTVMVWAILIQRGMRSEAAMGLLSGPGLSAEAFMRIEVSVDLRVQRVIRETWIRPGDGVDQQYTVRGAGGRRNWGPDWLLCHVRTCGGLRSSMEAFDPPRISISDIGTRRYRISWPLYNLKKT